MYVETREWSNEQPDGGIVYFVAADLYEDDGTKVGSHTRHWHLDVSPPSTGALQATRDSARQWALDHAEQMREIHAQRQQRRERRRERSEAAQRALENLEASS